ncbi:hypothetical protein YP76_11855 [Sphingobium chungbukense]|uniref:Uncharacterized protein n=1 Tax=Sphingobium chungbukense TaxID=56193 RepID=A0A0M3APQ5_9SPHN|nr:hypothetical protein YP76_11855 [Sphingobium chungbukense]
MQIPSGRGGGALNDGCHNSGQEASGSRLDVTLRRMCLAILEQDPIGLNRVTRQARFSFRQAQDMPWREMP